MTRREHDPEKHEEHDFEGGHDAEAVAIVGMAGRFPGARDVGELWRNQLAGVESITFFSAEELEAAGVPAEVYTRLEYVPAKGVVDRPELFDAAFFGLSPREAEIMDPQVRLFLETCWQAFEDAGYDPLGYEGRAGVYGGANLSSYLLDNLLGRPDLLAKAGDLLVRVTNDKDALTTWVAYKLDLKGPTVTVQTACSTSLVAVHFACQGLLDGECDLALAGGTAVSLPLRQGYLFQEGSILSPDGRCRPFDAEARGTVPGTGVGVVALKRLSDALRDGDRIRALVRGTAITNDGSQRAGYTAPGVEGQMRAVAEALALAEVEPETIGYVETHGSGTAVGDPIEIEALTRAYRRLTDARGFCALGSVKAAIGHLDSAAGVAGLIKTACALEARKLPPCLNFERPNPRLRLDASPFYVNTEPRDWPAPPGGRRRAGVSSFGIGGTNVHAVLEEAPPPAPGGPSRPWQLLLVSARSDAARERARAELAAHLESRPDLDLADAAFTLHAGRHAFAHRLAAVGRDPADAAAALAGADPRRLRRGRVGEGRDAGAAFLFPGLGDQHPGMGRELYRSEPTFRDAVDEAARVLEPELGLDLRQVLYPEGTDGEGEPAAAPDLRRLLGRDEAQSPAERRLSQTRLAHPIVFAVEVALGRTLRDWGLAPRAMIGYSLGEYAAACLAGVFSFTDGLRLVAARARLIDELPAGAMLAVPLDEAEVERRLEESADGSELAVAASNGAALTVVGGPEAAVGTFADRLEKAGVSCRRLRTTHAFHTPQMEAIAEPLARRLAAIELRPPAVPFVSNASGDWITAEEATDPGYWVRHSALPVRFTGGLARLTAAGDLALLEVGPGQALTTLARQAEPASGAAEDALPALPRVAALPDRREGGSELAYLLGAVGELWAAGVALDAADFYRRQERRRVALPTYPFERRRYWVEPGRSASAAGAGAREIASLAPEPGKKRDLAEWSYLLGWRRAAPARWRAGAPAGGGPWLLLADETGLGARLAELLRAGGEEVAVATIGEAFEELDDGSFTLDPRRGDDDRALLRALRGRGIAPRRIVHLWALPPADGAGDADLLERSFYSLLALAQALGEQDLDEPVEIAVVSSEVHEVVGGEDLSPPKAALLGPCQVIPQEMARVRCRAIDLEPPRPETLERQAADLLAELGAGDEPVVALRGGHRWLRTLESLPLPPTGEPPLRPGGAYLVSGGTEPTGLAVAEHLARRCRAHLALLAPAGFPPASRWTDAAAGEGPASAALRRLLELREEAGALEVIEIEGNGAEATAAAVRQARARIGALHGVVHAASASGAGLAQLKTRELAAPVFAATTGAAAALAAALDDEELDFFAVFSSTAALLGGIGQVDFCAANAVLDAFARRRDAGGQGTGSRRTVAIAWDSFRWESHDQDQAAVPEDLRRQLAQNLETFGIDAAELGEILERVLATRLSQVLISARDLPAVAAELEDLKGGDALSHLLPERPAGHRRPDLATPYREPETDTERALAGLWRDAFGIDRVGVDDDFFDLEGNSLVAVQIATRLRAALEVELPLAALFEAPTVRALAARVDELRREHEELGEVDELLAEIEALSEDEAELLLAREGEGA